MTVWSRSRLLAAAVAAVCLAVLAPLARAASSWVSCKDVDAPGSACLEVEGTRFAYALLDAESAAKVTVKGPRQVKVISRYLPAGGEPDRSRYTVIVRVDGHEVLRKTQASEPLASAARCDGPGRVTALRKATLELGPGTHELEVLAETAGEGRVACRIFRRVQRQRERYVSFSPEGYAAIRHVQFASGSQSTYYLATEAEPVVFAVGGETTLKVFARLDFDLRMKGSQSYALEVRCDGEVWRTLHFSSRKHSSALYVERPDLLPGTRDTFNIPVPRGRHTFTIRCVRPDGGAVALLIRIPRSDLER